MAPGGCSSTPGPELSGIAGQSRDMEAFLGSVERQAYRIALVSTGQREDALDTVQETMLRFVEKYSHAPRQQWKPLFYKILYSRITSLHRRRSIRNRWFSWLLPGDDDGDDPIEAHPDPRSIPLDRAVQVSSAFGVLEQALKELSLRQQQAFLLRAWEELSVAETAVVMQCSESSIKTHYSRALEVLRERLGDHWP